MTPITDSPGRLVSVKPRPIIACRKLPVFDPEDLISVSQAFQSATPCWFKQAWLAKLEDDFAPAMVQTGWRDNVWMVFARLKDLDIFSKATAMNQKLWELGDAFEIFLQPAGLAPYWEFQVAPNNMRLALYFDDSEALKLARQAETLDNYFAPAAAFSTRTWVDASENRWYVYAEIHLQALGLGLNTSSGSRWNFSFGRYDHSRDDRGPVISSTSPHRVPDFHRLREWGTLVLE